jgi:hypothetical protein
MRYYGDGRGDDCRSLIRFHFDGGGGDMDSYHAFYESKAEIYRGGGVWWEPPEPEPGSNQLSPACTRARCTPATTSRSQSATSRPR